MVKNKKKTTSSKKKSKDDPFSPNFRATSLPVTEKEVVKETKGTLKKTKRKKLPLYNHEESIVLKAKTNSNGGVIDKVLTAYHKCGKNKYCAEAKKHLEKKATHALDRTRELVDNNSYLKKIINTAEGYYSKAKDAYTACENNPLCSSVKNLAFQYGSQYLGL